ncbi:MAG: hypothetical protein JST92_09990 [Deltaproteobacteria bacterium]|nr:hypothetical protein [Deltaproteobacteria bacterium]
MTADPLTPADKRLPRLLAAAAFLLLMFTQGSIGFTRDEGYYFTAASSYEEWLLQLLHEPLRAISAASTEHFWGVNWEHPPLAKLSFALSHLVLTRWLHLLPDAVAWRMPAALFSGLLVYWLCQLGLLRSRTAGVLAPLLFFCAARPFFHGHLSCFDIPICALTVGCGLAWSRAIGVLPSDHKRPALWFAFLYGLALATKHNAWFLPPVLLVHALLLPAGLRRRALATLPWIFASPIVLFALWPLLWHAPLHHLNEWIKFHLHHVHYAWWYLGDLLRAPPFPIVYPLALLALTLPVTTVALLAAAAITLLRDFLKRTLEPQRLLELGLLGAGVLPFMTTDTPIFGGIKHWLVFVALLCPEAAQLVVTAALAASESLSMASARLAWLTPRRALQLSCAAALLPGLVQIARVHPYGTSAYGELAGDEPGAASLGMQRQYWSGNVTAVLPWINAHASRSGRVYLHEVNVESFRAYQQAGLLRPDLQYAWAPGQAEIAAIQWHREFRDREPETWNAYGTRRPVTGLYLDETPQVVVYARER